MLTLAFAAFHPRARLTYVRDQSRPLFHLINHIQQLLHLIIISLLLTRIPITPGHHW